MSFSILGLGTAVPTNAITQDEGLLLNQILCCSTKEQESWLPNLYKQSGINKRNIVLERQVVEDVLHGTRISHSRFVPRDSDDAPSWGRQMGRRSAGIFARTGLTSFPIPTKP